MKQEINYGFVIGMLLFFAFRVASAALPESTGLYLSFEQRLGLSMALAEHEETIETKEQLKKMALDYYHKFSALPAKTVKVKNFNHFLSLYKGNWPETDSVLGDVKRVLQQEPRGLVQYVAESPRIQRQIDRYLAWSQEEFVKIAKGNQQSEGAFKVTDFLNFDRSAFIKSQLDKLSQVGEGISGTAFAGISDAATRISMEVVLKEYFSRLSLNSKKLILSSYLGDNLLSSDMRRFELMVQNSGPQFQKLLQVMTRQDGIPADIAAVFKVLESSVRPVPWVQVQELLASEKQNFDFKYFERKPLGVGTMAQVHRAQLMENGVRQDVVVRFIKPGMEARVAEDYRILTEVAKVLDARADYRATGSPPLSPLVRDLSGTVSAELSQEDTIQRQVGAVEPYNKRLHVSDGGYRNYLEVHVPKVYQSRNKSLLMVQEMVFGQKLDKEVALYKEIAPNLKRVVVEELARLWASEVFFGSGFYHSDLHQGNFLLQVKETEIRLNILDFGMGGVISPELQAQVLLLGLGAATEDASLLAQALTKISGGKAALTEEQLVKLIGERIALRKAKRDNRLSIDLWVGWAVENGIKLPYEFVNLNRGLVILDKLLVDAGSRQSMSSIIESLSLSHPRFALQRLTKVEKVPKRKLLKVGFDQLWESLPELPQFMKSVPQCGSVFTTSAPL